MPRIKILALLTAAFMVAGVVVAAAPAAASSRGNLVKLSTTSLIQSAQRKGVSTAETLTAAERAAVDLVAKTGATPDAIHCFGNVSIQSNQNGNFVSTEMSYPGASKYMLRARATVIGPWELYSVCRDAGSFLTSIVSQASNLYVSEEQGYSGASQFMLRARASAFGPWEQWFTSQDPCDGCFTVFVSGQNGNYTSEEQGYSGANQYMLRARASAFGPWESFNW